jgi:type IV pilus assembly protein PilM
MFELKIDGALDIGGSGLKVVFYKNKKIEKVEYEKYADVEEEKIVSLQDALEKMSERTKLKGKNFIVTLPASKFNVKTLEYDLSEGENLEERMEEDLEELISGYSKEEFITRQEVISEDKSNKKILVVTIAIEEIQQILGILSNFKIKILKIVPDFVAVNNLVDVISQKSEGKESQNIMVVDIGGDTSKIFMSTLGTINMLRLVGIGGQDFTEIIKENEMLTEEAAETEKHELELGDDEERQYKTQGELAMFKDLTNLVNELTTQLENSIEYFNSNLVEGEIDKIYLTGGGSLIKGFKKHFDQAFKVPCVQIDLESVGLTYEKSEKNLLEPAQITTLIGALIKEVR